MAHNVNVTMTNARLTGSNVSVPQRAVDITITWKSDDGQAHADTRTANFPNILASPQLPAGWLQDQLAELCYKAVRIIAGLDTP